MNKDKISSQEIIDLLASKASVTKRVAEEFLKVMIASVEEALLAGEVVKIKNFGTFKLQWNEPRKSVNIHTGEEILLDGYYKVSFTPDMVLKNQVNVPFAHLEPIELDVDNDENRNEEQPEVVLDPLRIFTEQASEIKNIISQIQALSPNAKPVDSDEKTVSTVEINEEIVSENKIEESVIEKEVEVKSEEVLAKTSIIQSPEKEIVESKERIDAVSVEQPISTSTQQIESQYTSNPFLTDVKPVKKRKVWLWILLVLLLIGTIKVGLYLYCPPVTEWVNAEIKTCKNSVIGLKVIDGLNAITNWVAPSPKQKSIPETVVVPKDTITTDSIRAEQPVDSLQILFDTPRVYPDFITTVRMTYGTRLTRMAKRYYGTSDFWVYIYEANQHRIPDPDKIAVGTMIYIPKVDARLIDATNPRCIKKARELHDLYVK